MANEIEFKVTKVNFETLTWDEWSALQLVEEGNLKPIELLEIAVRFSAIKNENDQLLSEKEVRKVLGKLKTPEMGDVIKKLFKALKEYAVPKETGNA
jgi:hypothetical protein